MNNYGKVVKVSQESYDLLRELKFDWRLDTFEEVVSKLLKESISKSEKIEGAA